MKMTGGMLKATLSFASLSLLFHCLYSKNSDFLHCFHIFAPYFRTGRYQNNKLLAQQFPYLCSLLRISMQAFRVTTCWNWGCSTALIREHEFTLSEVWFEIDNWPKVGMFYITNPSLCVRGYSIFVFCSTCVASNNADNMENSSQGGMWAGLVAGMRYISE